MQTSNGFVQASLLPHTHYAAQGVEEHHHMPPKQQQPRYVAYTRGDAVEPAMMLMKQQQQLFANNFAQQQLASSNHAAAAFYNNHHLLLEKNAAALVAMSCAPHQLVSPSLLPHHPQQQQKQQQQQQQYHHYHHFPQQQQAPMTQLQYPTQQQQHLFQSANNNIFASPSHAMVPSLPSIHNFTKLQIEVNTSQNQDDALLDSVAYSKTLSPPSSMDMSNTQTEVAVAQDATEPIAVAATNPEQAISPTKLAAVQRRHEIYDHHHEFHSPLKKRKTARVVYHDNGCQVVPSSNQSSPVHLNDKKEMPTRNMRQPFYDNVPIIKQQQQQLYARSSNVDTDEGDDEEPNDDDEEQEEEEYSHFPHHHHHHESMDDFGAVDDDEEDEEDDDDDHDEDASFSLDSNANNKRKRFNNTKPSNQSLMLMPDDELEPEDEVEDDFDSETDVWQCYVTCFLGLEKEEKEKGTQIHVATTAAATSQQTKSNWWQNIR